MDSVSVRYIVHDVESAVAFYTRHLGFDLDRHPAPGFAIVTRGNLRLLLNQAGAGGAGQSMPDGRRPEPGGWNRVVLRVSDLPNFIVALKSAGLRFRNQMETGPGGRQVQIEDPDGNPIELFEPAR